MQKSQSDASDQIFNVETHYNNEVEVRLLVIKGKLLLELDSITGARVLSLALKNLRRADILILKGNPTLLFFRNITLPLKLKISILKISN